MDRLILLFVFSVALVFSTRSVSMERMHVSQAFNQLVVHQSTSDELQDSFLNLLHPRYRILIEKNTSEVAKKAIPKYSAIS